MDNSCSARVERIHRLLQQAEIDLDSLENVSQYESFRAEATWAIHHGRMVLQSLKSLLLYMSHWSTDSVAQTLLYMSQWSIDSVDQTWVSVRADIEAKLEDFESGLSADGNFHTKIAGHDLLCAVVNAYETLSGWPPHQEMSNPMIFDDFITSVQRYLESLGREMDLFFHPKRLHENYGFWDRPNRPGKIPVGYWLPYKENVRMEDITKRLEILRCFLGIFAKHCTDEEGEKSRSCFGRAAALVFSIMHSSYALRKGRYDRLFKQGMIRTFSSLLDKISPQDQEAREISLGVLHGYADILKAAKPSSSSAEEENVADSFLVFISSANSKAGILCDALDFPLRDLISPDHCTQDVVELFLKRGIEAVAREAGSFQMTGAVVTNSKVEKLWQKIKLVMTPMKCLMIEAVATNSMVEKLWQKIKLIMTPLQCLMIGAVETNSVVEKLWQKIKLIKAEVFLLELHNHKADLMRLVNNEVSAADAVREAMRSLTEFFKIPEGLSLDSVKFMLTLLEAVIREAGSFYNSNQPGSITEDVVSESSHAILMLFKAEAKLMVLINPSSSLEFVARYRIETLHKSLIFLRAMLSDPPNGGLESGSVSTVVEAMVGEAESLVCSFGNNKMEENHRANELWLSHLPKRIELNVAEIKAAYQQAPWSLFSSFPRSDGQVIIDFILGKLRELLHNNPDTIAFMKDQVEVLIQELEFLNSFLKDVKQKSEENEDLRTRVACLIYEAEYIIELFVTKDVPLWYHHLLVFNAVEETKIIKARIQEYVHDNELCDSKVQDVQRSLMQMNLEATDPRTDEVIVGFDKQAGIIVDQLETGPKKLQIVSIVGMPGIGKTTLAKKVYSIPSIQYRFVVRAWCHVSQTYRRRELLLDILEDFLEVTEEIKRMDDEDIAKTLFQSLKRKKYLIVMDDVWSIDPWNDLKTSLPDDDNGSRILFTSRLQQVALLGNPKRKPYVLPLLSDKKGWELLRERIFHGESFPGHLLDAGKLIAKNCKGLPLAIVVVAGLLKTDKRRVWWEEIAEHLRSRIAATADRERQFMDILELSYTHLPSYLKPCFLYLGIFLEDQEIPVQKLKRLWIAEGFIPKISERSEETAEDYLLALIGRSLVMESRRRSMGGPKTCRMHDMLRDLCLEKAREENFLHLIISRNITGNSESSRPSDSITSMHYRLSVHSPKHNFVQTLPFGPHVHSLLYFCNLDTEYKWSFDISSIPQNFKVLRVLDLEYIAMNEAFQSGIVSLFCLTYLAVRGNVTSLPPSIDSLWNLETLIVKGTRGQIALPDTIWKMSRLRHVQVHPRASFSLPINEGENSAGLDNLTYLSSPALSRGKDAERILTRLIGVKKMRCIFLKLWDNFRECNVFPGMDFLTQLECLKIFYHGRVYSPCEFSFPPNLKKLTLTKFRLPWENISAIAKLSNLEVLKLLSGAIEGKTWDMTEEGGFPRLKFLKLGNLNIEKWIASGDHFPELERLVLHGCKKLEEVPEGFGEIPTLQMIEMRWCSQSASNSIRTIYKQQLNWENQDFKVVISPHEWGISEHPRK